MRIAYALVLCLLLFGNENSYATSCRSEPVPVQKRFESADAVFVASFVSHSKNVRGGPLGATRATKLTVKKVFKGNLGKEATIFYKKSRPGCALDYFSLFNFGGEKEDLLIFAKDENGKFYTSEKMGSGFTRTSPADIEFLLNLK